MTDPIPIEVTVTETRVTTRTVFVTPSSSCMPDTGPTVETITVSVSIPSSNCTPSVTAAASGGQATQQAASVAIPVALVTVVTIVIVVVVGVIVCIKRGRGKLASDIRSSRHTSEPTDVHYVNTGIGRVRIGDGNTDSLRERTVTIKEVENELYQLQLNDNRYE